MVRALFITREKESKRDLLTSLAAFEVVVTFVSHNNGVAETVTASRPDIYLLEFDRHVPSKDMATLIRRLKKGRPQPVIALVPEELLDEFDTSLEIDDFIVGPYRAAELNARINRLLERSDEGGDDAETIKRSSMVINLATCEVKVEGIPIELTFKEYELLKLLAANPGRVYTREALLDSIWGYDYFGGDRTVDVHIRRLRSKIEEYGHVFIETVRNIGYRFKAE